MKKFLLSSFGSLVLGGLFFFAQTPAAFAAESDLQAGDLIRVGASGPIYILDADGYRHLFPTRSVFYSWFGNEGDATIVDAATFMSYKHGRPVTMRPGTSLIRFLSVDGVYAVERGGVLRRVADESLLEALYGDAWDSRVVEVSPALWSHYKHTGEDITEGYPVGTLMRGSDETVYYTENNAKREVADETFALWRFNTDFVVDSTVRSDIDDVLEEAITSDDFGDHRADAELALPY